MFGFHKNKEQYFNIQYQVSKEHIIPFLAPFYDFEKKIKVLEVGCAEAGILKPFIEKGHNCTGIEISSSKLETAKKFLKNEIKNGEVSFIHKDIYRININKDLPHQFDLIILKDVIEHIPEQEKLILQLKKFLNPEGKIFLGFPPWQMPFGGHQQMCENRFASILPWYHILPKSIYRTTLRFFGEKQNTIDSLLQIKETGISIDRFERILKKTICQIHSKKLFLINPIYKYKFNLKCREQSNLIKNIPYARNFFTTSVFYLISEY
jgi:SAM-dependent methyltransferase